jgi:hypothetical protein
LRIKKKRFCLFFKIRPSLKHQCRCDTRFARKSIIYTVYYAALFLIMQTDAANFYNMIHVFNIICIHHIIIVVKVRPHSFTCSSHLALTPSRQRCMYKRYAYDHCHVPTNSICIGLIVTYLPETMKTPSPILYSRRVWVRAHNLYACSSPRTTSWVGHRDLGFRREYKHVYWWYIRLRHKSV